MSTTALLAGLTRAQLCLKVSSCRAAQKRANAIGDWRSSFAQVETIDRLLDRLLELRQR